MSILVGFSVPKVILPGRKTWNNSKLPAVTSSDGQIQAAYYKFSVVICGNHETLSFYLSVLQLKDNY